MQGLTINPTCSEVRHMADAILKRCGRCSSSKPLSDFYRGGKAGYCIPCEKTYKRERYLANADFFKAKSREWAHDNKERKRATDKAWSTSNRERVAANQRAWVAKNPEKRKLSYTTSRARNLDAYRAREAAYRDRRRHECNERIRLWKKKNPHKLTFYFHKRRAAILLAIPVWADLDAIHAMYVEAQRMQRDSGIQHHVDHVVPLIHPLVCGLHCEANLRVIEAEENVRKGNRWWPDMP